MAVDYRVLGRLEVRRDERTLDLGAFRQHALLGLLLANAGTVLSTDRILDELWGETGGADKQSSLWVYVSGLRAVLEPGRAKRSEGTILLTRGSGYVLAVDREDTDAGRFVRSIADARAVAEADASAASRILHDALATWRGRAYEEFVYESWAQVEIERLEELRLEAIEDRIDVDLRLGLARPLLSELRSLVRQHPLRERFVRSSMLALYREGRAPEALRVFSAFRERLVAEVGVEPSRALRHLEHQILTDDDQLLAGIAVAAGPSGPRSGLTVRGYELRDELGRGAFGQVFRAFQPAVGREVAVKVIKPELADDPAFVRRFEAEAQLVAGLEHPHIVPLYDFWREPGAAYLVMRLIETGTLADALGNGALAPERAAGIFAQLTGALQCAHRVGVVHGDISPANVLIDRDGNAYVTDFGVAGVPDGDRPATGGESSSIRRSALPPGYRDRTLSTADDIEDLALLAATALTGMPGEYEQIRGALAPSARTVLDRATTADAARRFADVGAFGRALVDALGVREPVVAPDGVVENPYKGLRAFGPADAGDFFGRERLVERLIARLGQPGARGRFVALIGPSGSGKSSVVRAGLLPALAQGASSSSDEWFRIDMAPAPHPFEQLEAALLRVAIEPPPALLDVLLAPGGVRRAVQRILPDDRTQLLLVIDQFEELYTQVDDETASRFIDELVDVVTGAGTRVRVVITLRADFYDRPLRHRGLGELLREGSEVITPMSIDELQASITGPAARVGVDVEPQVVSEMVAEIVDRPGALPLLQYTMTELFEARRGHTVTLASYRRGGGVSRTLARRADSLLAALGPEASETARHVFLRLVGVDSDGNGADTRRRALVAEVEDLDDRLRVQRVLDTFGRHRLLSFDRDPVTRGPTVEISHEALLTEWTVLRTWIDDARDDLRVHRHLAGEMDAWIAAEQAPDYLLVGGRLDAVAAWAGTTTMPLRPGERRFLDASLAARDEEQRQRVAGQRRTAVAERRARQRTRLLVAAAAVAALVAALAGYVWVQRDDARRAQVELASFEEAQRLANVAVSTLADDPELSLLLATEAVRASAHLGYAVPAAVDAIHWALQALDVIYDVPADTPTAARFGPDGVKGVWVLPVEQLIGLADASTDRALTPEECRTYLGSSCPRPIDVADVDYLGGVEAYGQLAPIGEAEVVVGISAGLDAQAEEWRRNLDAISARFGLRVRLQQIPAHLTATEAAAQGYEADVFHLIGPGELPELAVARPLLDLRPFLDEATLVDDFGTHLVGLTRIGDDGTWPSDRGPIYGVMAGADSKAVVWTKEPEFADLGYEAPTDWASFLALADAVVADGRTPFCLELPSVGADGWPATDWVEMVVLRTGGAEFYDRSVRHEVPFDDPLVVDAIRTVGQMVHRPGYLDASPGATASREFGDALIAFTTQPDACLMTPFPSFMPAVAEAGAELGAAAFDFPTFGAGHDDAVVGGGGMVVVVADRPEVRRFMAAVASPEWGLGAAELDWPLLLPANARFDVDTMRNPVMREIVTGITEAVAADDFRFDGSDSMPPAVADAFGDGMMRLFREGSLETLDEVSLDIAGQIERAWGNVDPPD